MSAISLAPLMHTGAAFLRWWSAELAGLVPARVQAALAGQRAVLAVSPGEHGNLAAVLHRRGRAPEHLPHARSRAALAEAMRGMRTRPLLAVQLPSALQRRLTLPLAAADQLRQVLALDLDRQSPFRADEVRFTARIVARDRALRQLTVLLTIAPLAALADARALATSLGLTLHHAGPDAAPPWRDNLLAQGEADRGGRAPAGLAGLALLLLLAAALVPGFRAQRHLDRLESELRTARAEADAALAARAAQEAATAPGTLVRSLGEPATSLVATLTAALPDDAVLRRLSLRDGRLEINGGSAGTAELVRSLSQSPAFAQVEYRSPVVATGARENFHLALSPRPAASP